MLNKNLLSKVVSLPCKDGEKYRSILNPGKGQPSCPLGGGHMYGSDGCHAGWAMFLYQRETSEGLSRPGVQNLGFVTHCCFNYQGWILDTSVHLWEPQDLFGKKD